MEREYTVYKHTNKLNGKIYIGQTCQKTRIRWGYGGGYRKNLHFYAAIKKYGWNNFEHEVIQSGLSKQEADFLEIELIAEYKTTDSRFGYNIAIGGASGARYHTEDEKSAALKRIQHIAYKKMVSNPDYAAKMRAKSLATYYANKNVPCYMKARSISNHKSRAKVHEIRDRLREFYKLAPNLFSAEQYKLAFEFTANRKSYVCNSIKTLNNILEDVRSKYSEEKSC